MMDDTPVHSDQPDSAEASGGSGDASLSLVRQALTVLVVIITVAYLLYLLSTHNALGDAWTTQVMLCAVALLAAAWGAVHRRHYWTVPMRRLREHVRLAHRGEVTIESLSDLGGGPAELAPVFQELLRDLRMQKAEVAALEAEMRHRLASRTGALERTIDTLRHQATRDGLTGLFNRRFLDSFLPQAVQKCQASKAELCLLMIDVDHFKKLNDTLGHPAGDALLKSIGQIIRSTARGEDVAFRFGGDEFAIVMIGSNEKAGKALADRITSLVDALCKTFKVTPRPRLSVGIVTPTTLPDGHQATAEQLLAEADKRLYAVKAAHHAAVPQARPTAATATVHPPTNLVAPIAISGSSSPAPAPAAAPVSGSGGRAGGR
jgi:diguanylate cyclase (GGDEF)-like protein